MGMIEAAKRRCEPPLKPCNVQTRPFIRSCSKMKKTIPSVAALAEEEWAAITAARVADVADILRSSAWTERRYWNRCRAKPAAGCLRFPENRQSRRFTLRLKKIFATNIVWDTRQTGPIPAKAFIRSASRRDRRILLSMPERNITGDSKSASKPTRDNRPCTNE